MFSLGPNGFPLHQRWIVFKNGFFWGILGAEFISDHENIRSPNVFCINYNLCFLADMYLAPRHRWLCLRTLLVTCVFFRRSPFSSGPSSNFLVLFDFASPPQCHYDIGFLRLVLFFALLLIFELLRGTWWAVVTSFLVGAAGKSRDRQWHHLQGQFSSQIKSSKSIDCLMCDGGALCKKTVCGYPSSELKRF